MSLDSIQQSASTILEMQKLYSQLQQQDNPQSVEKMKQTRKYVLNLTKSIQSMVQEEKKNVG